MKVQRPNADDVAHGTRAVQALLDTETRPVPAALRAVGDARPATSGVPRSRYTSRAVHELEVDAVWRRVWQMACREEQIAEPGDSLVYGAPGVSLILVRSGPDEIRAFHNSCLHRGTQLRTRPGPVTELRCPFHGFTWNLDGSFAGMPCPWDFPHVDAERFGLPEARVASWGGFVFVSVDAQAPSLSSYLEILPEHFASWDLGARYLSAHVVRVVPCNWKVALEAFIESYHTVAVHPQLLKTSGDTQTEYDVWDGVRHVNRMITPVGIASEHVDAVAEQDILDAMFLTKDDPDALVPDGATARSVLAQRTRRQLAERTGGDFDAVTDCEALDAIEYFVFPNFVPWAGYTTPLTYRFRPNGDDHRSAVMDVMLLEPLPVSGPRPAPSPTRHLAAGERWADAPELGYLGRILDQDTATLARVQHGLETGGDAEVTLAREQECRIRHFHATLGEYLGEHDGGRDDAPAVAARPVRHVTTRSAPSVWEADDGEPVRDTTVGGILRDAAHRTPDETALVEGVADRARRRRWSYAELLVEAEAVARALSLRLSPGARLAVAAPSLPESLMLTYGAALAGVVLVPVNPALRTEELRHVLGQSGTSMAFTVAEHRGHRVGDAVAALARELPALGEVVDFADWDAFRDSATHGAVPGRTVSPDDMAQLVYTSGTTGAPKGALLTHRGMTNAARFGAVRFGMHDGDVYVHTMPLFHVGGQVVSFQLCQCSATNVLVHVFEPGLVLDLLETEGATLTCGVPTMLDALIVHPDFTCRDLSTLRAVSGGGAIVPAALVRHIEDALGVQFTVVFGQTEASGFISQTHLDDAPEDKGATLGQPLPRVAARVVGPDGAVVARGTVGELEVRGPNVMAGYHDMPDAAAEAFAPDGWLRTGDLVTMDERGFLRMAGRRKEMIVSGGENIFPAEIEGALAAHADVAEVAVVGVPDARWGEAAVAVVVPAPDRTPDPAELERYLRDLLAPFKVPRRWAFVASLPRTASGKVQKHRIPLDGVLTVGQ